MAEVVADYMKNGSPPIMRLVVPLEDQGVEGVAVEAPQAQTLLVALESLDKDMRVVAEPQAAKELVEVEGLEGQAPVSQVRQEELAGQA